MTSYSTIESAADVPQASVDLHAGRIRELRAHAQGQGRDLRPESHDDFWDFIKAEPELMAGNMDLDAKGNLNLAWGDENESCLTMQFIGEGKAIYLILVEGGSDTGIAKVSGNDTFEGIRRQIDAFGLRPMLQGAGSPRGRPAHPASDGRAGNDGCLSEAKMRAYEERISELHEMGDEDGVDLSRESHDDLWRFVKAEPGIRKGGLTLGDDGVLQLVWRDGAGTRLGVEFFGSGQVRYVIFRKRGDAQDVSRVVGRDIFEGLMRQIDVFDLRPFLYS